MTGMTVCSGTLAGVRVAVERSLDVPVAALRAAGAEVVHTADDAEVALTTATGAQAPWGVAPTPGVIAPAGGVTVSARTLEAAGRVAAVLAAAAPDVHWPADTRLAAPPAPVVAVPDRLPGCEAAQRAALDAAVGVLTAGGARIVPTDVAPLVAAEVVSPGARRALPRDALRGADAVLMPSASAALLRDRFDLCGVTAPTGVTVLARAFDDAVAHDVATLATGGTAVEQVWPLARAEVAELVVFGAHLRGGPLAHQLTDAGARWAGELTTVPRYRMAVLATTPVKPAVTRVPDGVPGAALTGHRWLLSPAALGRFLVALPAPMQLGKVEFADGSWRTAFGCDGSAPTGADVSRYGSWPAAVAAGAD